MPSNECCWRSSTYIFLILREMSCTFFSGLIWLYTNLEKQTYSFHRSRAKLPNWGWSCVCWHQMWMLNQKNGKIKTMNCWDMDRPCPVWLTLCICSQGMNNNLYIYSFILLDFTSWVIGEGQNFSWGLSGMFVCVALYQHGRQISTQQEGLFFLRKAIGNIF